MACTHPLSLSLWMATYCVGEKERERERERWCTVMQKGSNPAQLNFTFKKNVSKKIKSTLKKKVDFQLKMLQQQLGGRWDSVRPTEVSLLLLFFYSTREEETTSRPLSLSLSLWGGVPCNVASCSSRWSWINLFGLKICKISKKKKLAQFDFDRAQLFLVRYGVGGWLFQSFAVAQKEFLSPTNND